MAEYQIEHGGLDPQQVVIELFARVGWQQILDYPACLCRQGAPAGNFVDAIVRFVVLGIPIGGLYQTQRLFERAGTSQQGTPGGSQGAVFGFALFGAKQHRARAERLPRQDQLVGFYQVTEQAVDDVFQ